MRPATPVPAPRPARALAGVAALLLCAAPAAAQSVTGTLSDHQTGQPIAGAMVVLLGAGDSRLAGAITGLEGRFAVAAPAPGEYRVRAERVGYRSITSAPISLAAGESREVPMRMPVEAVSLEGVTVSARQRCVVRPAEGVAAAAVWEEARKALSAARLVQAQQLLRYRVRTFDRVLDPTDLRVLQASERSGEGYYEQPFTSIPAGRLAEQGFVEPAPDGHTYHAPDAEVLLSDAFLDTHCFEVAEHRDSSHLVGLAFRPIPGRTRPEIRGTFWLERASASLRHLEYRYTNLPVAVGAEAAGGRVDFEQLPSGGWIVRRWRIRMPQIGTRYVSLGAERRPRTDLVGIREAGGEVLEAESARAPLLSAAPRAVLTGVVYDSTRGGPAVGARVSLHGTAHEAVTDSLGRFRLPDLAGGRYRARLLDTRMDSLGLAPPEGTLDLEEGKVVMVRLAVPSWETLGAALCPEEAEGAALIGSVRMAPADAPAAGAEVSLRWDRWSIRQDGSRVLTGRRSDERVLRANPSGWFHACGLPAEQTLELRVAGGGGLAAGTDVKLARGETRRLALQLEVPAAADYEVEGVDVTALSAETRRDRAEANSHVNRIGRAEIEALRERGAARVQDLLKRHRGHGLRVRPFVKRNFPWGVCVESTHATRTAAAESEWGCAMVMVVLDGVRLELEEAARTVAGMTLAEVEEVEYLPPTEATFRFGTVAGQGALVLTSRR